MKAIKIIVVTLLVIVIILGIGLVVFLKTLDLNRYKGLLSQQVSQRINRQVSVGDLGLGLSLEQGVTLNVNNFEIKDSPEFSQGAFLKVEKLLLNLDVMPLIKERRIVVSHIGIIRPEMTMIRDSQGRLNLPLPEEGKKPASPPQTSPAEAPPAPAAQQEIALPEILIKSLSIEKGQCVFVDKAQDQTERQFQLNNLDLEVNNFSLNRPFDLEMNAALWSDKDNLQAKAKIQMDLVQRQGRVTDGVVSSDLSLLSLSDMAKAIPQIKDLLVDGLQGKFQIRIAQMTAGEQGLMSLALDGELKEGKAILKSLPLPIENLRINFNADERDFQIPEISLLIAQSPCTGKAVINDYLKNPKYQIETNIPGLVLGPVASALALPVSMEGQLTAVMKISASGMDPDTITKSLSGNGNFSVDRGRFKDFNILKAVFSKIPMLPDVMEKFQSGLPEKYRDIFTRNDTIFEKIGSDLKMQGKDIFFNNAQVMSDFFALEAQGQADLEQNVMLEASIFFPPDLSKSMVERVPEMGSLVLEDGRIKIPLSRYQGKLAGLKVFPDLEYLGKRFIVSKGTDEIQKLLKGVFGGEDQPAQNTTDQTPNQGQAPQQQSNPEKQMINGILDSIFKKD